MLLDLDRFKEVNDTLGHHTGDVLLEEIASRVQEAVGPDATVARLGGDEFAVLCPAIGSIEDASQLADRLVDAISTPLCVDEAVVHIGLSIGIAALVDGDGPDEVLARADAALRDAKRSGKRRWALAR